MKDVVETYNTVTSHLSTNLASSAQPAPGASPVSHTMLDLLILFVPHLPSGQSRALFTATASTTMLEHHDATVQKKSYRLLSRLLESGKVFLTGEEMESLIKTLNDVAAGVGPGTQRDRLALFGVICDKLPKESLGLLTELLSEAVLGTKEVNEKARDGGFDLLVKMGHRMAGGGTVKRESDEMEEEGDLGQSPSLCKYG